MNFSAWKRQTVDVLDLHLDELNPRVFVDNPTQGNIRKFLIENYDVKTLAKSIFINNGVAPTDNIVCVVENSKLIVIEGNRRTAACQLLRNPELVPEELIDQIPSNDNIQQVLKKVDVIVAPSRDEAEPTITLRHTVQGIKGWSILANVRRVMIRYDKRESVSKIARVLDIPVSQVKNAIRFHNFLEYVINEIKWDSEDKKKISNPLLEMTKIDRFLPFSKEAKDILKINFDDKYNFYSELPKYHLDKALKDIFKRAFITNNINTRTKKEAVFNKDIQDYCTIKADDRPVENQVPTMDQKEIKYDNTSGKENSFTSTSKSDSTKSSNENFAGSRPTSESPKENQDTASKGPTDENIISTPLKPQTQPKPKERKRLFEDIVYEGKYTGISRCLYELHHIDQNKFALSSTYLVRTLIEGVLQGYLNKLNLKARNDHRDPTLSDLINFYVSQKVLMPFNNQYHNIIKDFQNKNWTNTLNAISHAKYQEPSVSTLLQIEKSVYLLIRDLINEIN